MFGEVCPNEPSWPPAQLAFVDLALPVHPPCAHSDLPSYVSLATFSTGDLDTAKSRVGGSHVEQNK